MISAIFLPLLLGVTSVLGHPHLYSPYYNFFRYNDPFLNPLGGYAAGIPNYTPFLPYYNNLFGQRNPPVEALPTINILAEVPYSTSNKFTVVPMLVVSQDNMKMIQNGDIMSVSKTKPIMTIKKKNGELKQCTPAVRITLDVPILVNSLKTSIVFPSEINIAHGGYSIPIKIGAVIAPVKQNTYISTETPINVNVLYGIPTTPIHYDYINNEDAVFIPETEAVIVETPEPNPDLPPKNITVIDFPDREAEPVISVDEEDEELVNRNPQQPLAPAGIVQSTQPQTSLKPFSNSKESPVLTDLREESKKRRLFSKV